MSSLSSPHAHAHAILAWLYSRDVTRVTCGGHLSEQGLRLLTRLDRLLELEPISAPQGMSQSSTPISVRFQAQDQRYQHAPFERPEKDLRRHEQRLARARDEHHGIAVRH